MGGKRYFFSAKSDKDRRDRVSSIQLKRWEDFRFNPDHSYSILDGDHNNNLPNIGDIGDDVLIDDESVRTDREWRQNSFGILNLIEHDTGIHLLVGSNYLD